MDNRDPIDLSDYKTNIRKTFRGKAKLWLQCTKGAGDIKIEAKSKSVTFGEVIIENNN